MNFTKAKSTVMAMLAAYLFWSGAALGVIAQGIRKQTIYKKQTSLGTIASGAGGQILRRENSVFTRTDAPYESDEIVSHQQSTGTRHGVQAISGKINGLLSPGTYSAFLATICRKDFVVGVNSTALVNVTAASTGTNTGTFTRAAGSFLTDGFKVGDVIRWAGWTTTAVTNNAHNMVITALTATVMTVATIDAVAVAAKVSGDSVTATVTGKKTLVPLTGHTDDLHTFEEWYPDTSRSEQFSDVKLNQVQVDIPGSGNTKLALDFVGLRRILNAAQQFTSPTVETTTGITISVTGFLLLNGVELVYVTGMQLTIDANASADGPVVGSNTSPDIARGRVKVSGNFSAYFQDATIQTLYETETVCNLIVVVCSDQTAASDFVAFNMGRIKINGDAPDDGEKGIIRQYPFVAEINTAGGAALASDQTIISVQDSQA